MLIALMGAPGAGKDTIAKRLVDQHGFVRFAFADKVRQLAYETLSASEQLYIDNLGWDVAKRRDDFYRAHLERVGDGARKVLGEDVWIKQIRTEVFSAMMDDADIVITDLRKENERDFVSKLDGVIWHVHRPSCERRPFDEWREEWAAFSIPNNGELEDLHRHVDECLELCR